jgi:hypothetical protein
MQTAFALALAASVLKYGFHARGVLMSKNYVGNQLLEARVLFHFAPWPITGVLGTEQFFQVSIRVGREPLKMS